MDITLRTKDHPEANGRQAKQGEHGYSLKFPLESGSDLIVQCGDETFVRFSDMIGRLLIDLESEKSSSGLNESA